MNTKIQAKMISIREDQYDRLLKFAKDENRSMRGVLEIMLDEHDKSKKR